MTDTVRNSRQVLKNGDTEEFRLVLAGLQGKVYLIEVKNIHLSGSEYPFQGYLTTNHG